MARHDLIARSKMDDPEDQKDAIFERLGNLDQYEMLDDEVLTAIYAPSNTLFKATGPDGKVVELVGTDNQTSEFQWQGKIGCVVKVGPTAFKYHMNGQPYEGLAVQRGDWVLYFIADSRELHLRGAELDGKGDYVICRRLSSLNIKMRIKDPRTVR